jgi:hypothetical protein
MNKDKTVITAENIKKSEIGFINYQPGKIPDYDRIITLTKTAPMGSSQKNLYNKTKINLQKFIETAQNIIRNEMTFKDDVFKYIPSDPKHKKIFFKLKNLHKNQLKCEIAGDKKKKVSTSGFFSSTFKIDEIKTIAEVLNRITRNIDACFTILNTLAEDYSKLVAYVPSPGGNILSDSGLAEAQQKQLQQSYRGATDQQPQQQSTLPTNAGIHYGGYKKIKTSLKKLNRKMTKKVKK